MNICLIQKKENTILGLEKYLDGPRLIIQKIYLEDFGSFGVLQKTNFDVLIFDVMTPGENMEDVLLLKKIKEIVKATPILLATNNRSSSKYREGMLDAGVDGCIQSPFLKEELLLRLEKLLQKKNSLLFSGTTIKAHYVEMDIRSHSVEIEGKKISLTKTEYSILFHLFLHKGTLVAYQDLIKCLGQGIKKDSPALNIHIFNLRKKIKDMNLIKTIPLYGFTISDSYSMK